MSPIIQATIALNFCTIVGMVAGYYLRKFTHECPEHGPFVRVPSGGRAHVALSGHCELGPGFAEVAGDGSLTIEMAGPDVSLGPGQHDLAGVTLKGTP